MTKHLIDRRGRDEENARLRAFVTIKRRNGAPAEGERALYRTAWDGRDPRGLHVKEFLRIERGNEV